MFSHRACKYLNFLEGGYAFLAKRDHSFSTYAKKTNISYHLIRTRMCACQGVRNARFSENFECVLTE